MVRTALRWQLAHLIRISSGRAATVLSASAAARPFSVPPLPPLSLSSPLAPLLFLRVLRLPHLPLFSVHPQPRTDPSASSAAAPSPSSPLATPLKPWREHKDGRRVWDPEGTPAAGERGIRRRSPQVLSLMVVARALPLFHPPLLLLRPPLPPLGPINLDFPPDRPTTHG